MYYTPCTKTRLSKCWWVLVSGVAVLLESLLWHTTSLSSAVNTHKTAADTSDNLDDATCTLEQLVWESESEIVLNVRWSSWTKQSLVASLLFLSVWVWGSCLQRKVISEILVERWILSNLDDWSTPPLHTPMSQLQQLWLNNLFYRDKSWRTLVILAEHTG